MVEIVSTSGVLGGKHRIEGRRISVADIVVQHQEHGWRFERMAREFGLKPAEVAGALEFYFENPRLIRAEIREEHRTAPA